MPSNRFRKKLWEIFVPRTSNSGIEYTLEHHRVWDEQVRTIAGGLTIFKKSRGQWINPKGDLFNEEMIPVRIYCSPIAIERIIGITIKHYDQEAVFAYEISDNIILRYRKQCIVKLAGVFYSKKFNSFSFL